MKIMRTSHDTDLNTLAGDTIAVDTETTGVFTFLGDRPFAFSFCNEKGETRFYRWQVNPFTRQVTVNNAHVQMFRKFFSDPRRRFVFWNAKFDVRMFSVIGVRIDPRQVDDAMFAFHMINSGELSFKLKVIAAKYADYPADDEKELKKATMAARRAGKKMGWMLGESLYQDYWMAPPQLLSKYAVGDVERTIILWMFARDEMIEQNVRSVYDDEMSLWPDVYDMEERGIRIDMVENDRRAEEYRVRGEEWRQMIYDLSGYTFNIESDDELRWVLFEKLKLPICGYTEKVQLPSVDSFSMVALRDTHGYKIGDAIMGYRSATKAQASWFGNYRRHAVQDMRTGEYIVHTDFRQIGPRTGRFSCANPNLQNAADDWSTRTKNPMPVQARAPFGPRAGYVWWSIDYSQIENRIFADIAGEKKMLDKFAHDVDVHAITAHMCWPEEYARELITGEKKIRSRAKVVNFGIIYGIGSRNLAPMIGCSVAEAKAYIDWYKKQFPDIRRCMDELIVQAKTAGEIRTVYGRRIPVDPGYAYRAINYIVQGSAADVLKLAMRQTAKLFRTVGADAHLAMTIHDELVFEVNKKHAYRWLLARTQKAMEDHGGKFSIPLPTDASRIVSHWHQKEKIKDAA